MSECDHAHYRQTRDLPDRVTHKEADYVMTCTKCGHVWTAPAPILQVEIAFEVLARASVDLVTYFRDLREQGRKEYAEFTRSDEDEDGYEDWERPMSFLTRAGDEEFDGISLVPHRVFSQQGMPQPIRENVEVDRQEFRVRTRDGKSAYSSDWSEEDFDALRAHVPWLDKFHQTLNDEVDEEDLARTPGPNDTPLEGLA